jgi:SAM-dependent methyltransferase
MPVTPASSGATRPLGNARTAVVWELLRSALDQLSADAGGEPVRVLDIGGGTGGFAVPLAELGHRVTVVDPSPDSLAALERRAAETGSGDQIRALQGDASGVAAMFPPGTFDAVLCHSVLEVVDDPLDALRAVSGVLRSGGAVSVLAANRVAAVLARAAAGRLAEARRLLADPAGSAGAGDPLLRRFTPEQLQSLIIEAGLSLRRVHGVRVFADLVPPAMVDSDADAAADLLALEHGASAAVGYLAIATQLHVLADRP